jgi:hypothetical protein
MASPAANSLPQYYGFSPGTSLIGKFGSTEPRFSKLQGGGVPEAHNPGPGAYTVPEKRTLPIKWGWGTGKAHHNAGEKSFLTPGPGSYGSDPTWAQTLQKQWPGRASASAFGTNKARDEPGTSSIAPGPGRYNAEEASHFISGPNGTSAAHSPFVGVARACTGSRLRRDMDCKETSVFSSKRPAQAIMSIIDTPGPGQYAPSVETIGARAAAAQARRQLQHSNEASFDSTASRFSRDPMSGAPEPHNPGPGAHSVARWTGVQPSSRKPRSVSADTRSSGPHAQALGFLCGTTRFQQLGGGKGKPTDEPDAVLRFLASGPLGPVGTATHTQSAITGIRGPRPR